MHGSDHPAIHDNSLKSSRDSASSTVTAGSRDEVWKGQANDRVGGELGGGMVGVQRLDASPGSSPEGVALGAGSSLVRLCIVQPAFRGRMTLFDNGLPLRRSSVAFLVYLSWMPLNACSIAEGNASDGVDGWTQLITHNLRPCTNATRDMVSFV